jgi:GNAT superfamily N-acetyltransferase
MEVRPADAGDLPGVMGVLDAGMLDADATAVERRIEAGAVLVADEGGPVLGACVLDSGGARISDSDSARGDEARDGGGGAHVDAVAVRPGRRGQGVGSALVEAAADRWTPLTADFDADRRPFYEPLGFRVESIGDGRCRGVLE